LPDFDITLVGEANLDLLLYGLPEDLTVEREWIASRMAMMLGGSPAITAHNLAAMGSRVGFITPIAGDVFAEMCLRSLMDAGVDLSRAVRVKEDLHTGVSILLQHDHSRRMLTYPGATGALRFEDIDLDYLARSRHFHFSSYFLQEGLRPDAARLLAWCKQAGLTTSLDTNDDPSSEWHASTLDLLRHVDIFMPNEGEACRITGQSDAEGATRTLVARVPLLVVKRGKRGALACRSSERWEAQGINICVVDAVGAGDSFNAGFLHGFLRNWPVDKCLEFGNLAGAFSTTQVGGIEAFRNRDAWQAFAAKHAAVAVSPNS
jgi:sugar/nucleoside kinase (ribokinase family)